MVPAGADRPLIAPPLVFAFRVFDRDERIIAAFDVLACYHGAVVVKCYWPSPAVAFKLSGKA